MGPTDSDDDEQNSIAPSIQSSRTKKHSINIPRLPALKSKESRSLTRSKTLQFIGLPDKPERRNSISRIAKIEGNEKGKKSGSAGRILARRKTANALHETETESESDCQGPTPFQRFRLKARAVKWLCYICTVYMREASDRALKGSLLELVEDILCAAEQEARRTGNDANMPRGLVSPAYPDMTFDAAEFQRFSKREEGLPNKIKELLRVPEDERTAEQIQNIVRHMQSVEEFAKFPPELQKRLCKYGWYESFGRNRVVTKEGQFADGLYFVLSGKLTETYGGQTYILKKGDKFGENDLIQATRRSCTVMTKNAVELFCVHAQDYALVFDTEMNIKEEACIDYLRTLAVFKAWSGLDLLLDSPVYWGKQNYRAGQVIVADSLDNEWIYVIKAGTCDVLKKLTPGICPWDKTKKHYKEYKKAKGAREIAMAHKEHALSQQTFITSDDGVKTSQHGRRNPLKDRKPISGISDDILERRRMLEPGMWTEKPRTLLATSGLNGCIQRGTELDVPYCVRVAELEAGDVFGILSVTPGYQEASVSLVSQGAEAIKVSKAFFLKYADERVFTQIEMRYEPYPSQEDCLDDLDLTDQWQRYKKYELQQTLQKVEERSQLKEILS
ncbi:Cyclic nucleotide-binding domain-containing protein 2 [Holothuria leucospilota]|uniref:Cyclic nucleotide-binding domain-containing protein 2 n=1 Tax=Holothuria leucospilota TaxID=206669 RepID=A0A9Q1BKC2_HOLLE|nr:Cyclic nucleotide-binding domain-containing protein 2 [Holothuria leucospilota]